ncbi:glycoside hydrolase family 16 protein [Mucilaginibacter flavus]|uniref:glycoside hydrolase family 16 protein n=1 Tax=Mucilaginibacter flavus TaxID=931504 RepID=UPI0025B57DF4|nr:glycoside hydrolase family 16 protein [Mucilaginibacter flavus]MDN3581012.1 glycoside hydrolase family 16 protein [Mucilaginibacter flavus]
MKKICFVLLAAMIAAGCSKEKSAVNPAAPAAVNTVAKKKEVASTLSFGGYTWVINAPAGQTYPGPNYWNASYAWVDANGWLHLKAAYNSATGHWECAEVYTTASLGYGTYQWQVEGAIGSFDKNIVLGMYNYSGNDQHDEMDIEIARWGNAAWDNLNYTIWPATGVTASPGVYTASFTTPNGTYTTHRFKRTSTSVKLQSLYGFQDGDANQFQTATFNSPGTSISTLSMPVHMNLWLYGGSAPTNGQNVEIIIHSFKFTAL